MDSVSMFLLPSVVCDQLMAQLSAFLVKTSELFSISDLLAILRKEFEWKEIQQLLARLDAFNSVINYHIHNSRIIISIPDGGNSCLRLLNI